jgi:hypothetical protein
MGMGDWSITGAIENNTGDWVYYENPNFQGIHFSRHVDNHDEDHMGDGQGRYYYGVTGTYNGAALASGAVQAELLRAWEDYFTV